MKHKIELIKEYSEAYDEMRLYVVIDGRYLHNSFKESDMAEALTQLAKTEKLLREGKTTLHVVEIE